MPPPPPPAPHQPPRPAPEPRASTSRTSLDDLARADGEAGTSGGARTEGDKPHTARTDSPAPSSASAKGKERDWSVELAVLAPDGADERGARGGTDGAERGNLAPAGGSGQDRGTGGAPAAPGATQHGGTPRPSSSSDAPTPVPTRPLEPATASSSPPPPAPEQPARPSRPPLQSILKRPELARPASSQGRSLASSTPLPLLSTAPLPPAQPAAASAPLTPTQGTLALDPPTPDSVDDENKDKLAVAHPHTVLFSTPGTTTSVLPLSSPSRLSHHSGYSSSAAGEHGAGGGGDFTGTFRSWKSSVMGRKSGVYEKKRLAELGFDEELSRDYDFFASFGITICNVGGLPGTTLGVLTALEAGGGSMYAIAWPLSGLFMMSLAAVLGEMASTWPVAGAMFTWVFRLCRSRKGLNPWARYASWVVGSLLLCSHILLQIVCTWQFAHNLLGVVGLWTEKEYSYWVVVAISWGIVTFSALVVSSRISRSPWLWRICGALIILFFITINITLLTTADRIAPAEYVFTSYRNSTGFTSKSYVYMLGWVLTCVATGMEASAHMAEDTKRPSRTVPLAMFWSVAATYIMGWVSICVLLATMRLDGLDPDLQPSIALLANSIPRRYTTLILVLVLFSFLFQNVAQLLATSRYIWALARESALPFSTFFRRLSEKNRTPTAAIWVVWAIAFPALLLVAINVSIIATTLLEGAGITCAASYVAPLLFYLACPAGVLNGDGRAKWTLRGASKVLAAPAAVFLLTFIVMMSLPTGYPVTALNASYASAILLGVLLLSSLAWVVYGNARYAGPIKTTTRWTIGAEVDLRSGSQGAQGTGRSRKKSSAQQQQQQEAPVRTMGQSTTSEEHGRSAHVWATSNGGAAGESRARAEGDTRDDERSAAWTYASGEVGERTGETTTGTETGTGSGWSEYTSEGDEESTGSEEDEDEEERRSPSRSRGRARDEEHRVS
ncbi:uncharacterized protein RHOBADRAFT_56584 [Rhodotorula graminis WP1]|uniref:Amino acid permease/ SLC12A domain-containing protein n=1 Tax=Rhodotorula graminis (strain WP1) TaxID=578459 RepID=A0A0P9GFE9_RHOGW|nr:uncharacterized protein RHOBADRAFT_56584 [Rhodotorula graminis WP1]KPV71547.1 hypothetical protein RHOBADRAFT_56584 [Rhodotorula graminis WP1]